MRRIIITISILLAAVASCNRRSVFPPAGSYSEVVLVTETGERGGANDLIIRELQRELDYYTRTEIQFRIRMIPASEAREEPPTKNMVIFGVARRGVVGSVIESFIGTNATRKVLEGRNHIFKKIDYPYSGQLTLIVTASSEERLRNVVRENGDLIRGIIEEANRERLRDYLLADEKSDLTERLAARYGFSLRIPFIYELLQERPEVPGVEVIRREPHRGISVSWMNWNRESLSLADSSALYQMRADFAWKMYEKDVMRRDIVYFHEDMLGEYDAIRMDGYWENSEDTFGGPFTCFFIQDKGRRRLWMVDCLVYAPGFDKHTLLRELRAIAETFTIR